MPTPDDDTTEAPPVVEAEATPQAEAPEPTPRRPGMLQMAAGNSPMAIIPGKLGEVVDLAKAIHASGLAPATLNSPDKVTVAILKGLELGLPPMQALDSIAVINGRASIWGDIGMALIHRSGLLESWEEGIDGEGDTRVAWVEIKRKNMNRLPTRKTYSVQDATRARLWQGMDIADEAKRGKSPWVRHDNVMLLWRARWPAMRLLFSDVLRNMPGAEELQDEPIDVTPNAPPPPAPRKSLEERLATGTKPEVEIILPTSNEGEKINTGSESQPEATQSVETASGQDDTPERDEAAGGATGAAEQWPEGVRQPADMFEASMVLEIAHAVRAADPPLTPERMAVLWGEFGETVQLMTGDGQEIARGLFTEAGEAVGVTGGPWII